MSQNSRLQTLDSARAIAALLVVVMHVSENWASFDATGHEVGRAVNAIAVFFQFGILGVYFFFLISVSSFPILSQVKVLPRLRVLVGNVFCGFTPYIF